MHAISPIEQRKPASAPVIRRTEERRRSIFVLAILGGETNQTTKKFKTWVRKINDWFPTWFLSELVEE